MEDTIVIIDKNRLVNIADFIRTKFGKEDQLSFPNDFQENIDKIQSFDDWFNHNLTEYNNNTIDRIKDFAFNEHNLLKNVSATGATSIGSYGFSGCEWLQTINTPNIENIGEHAFYACRHLDNVHFPLVTEIGPLGFCSCGALTSIDFPLLTTVGMQAFNGCSNIKDVCFPLVTALGNKAFAGCNQLESADFPILKNMSTYVFDRCVSLKSLFLRNPDAICYLGDVNAFGDTPIASGTGYIYVPSELVDQYKVAKNWSTFASQIRGIDGNIDNPALPNKVLFGITQSFSLSYYSPEENPVITVTSSNENVATIENLVIADGNISFDVVSLNTEGETIITVRMAMSDRIQERVNVMNVYETYPIIYEVEQVEGADHGFLLNDNGYYESQNAGVKNSYSICKVSFCTDGTHNIYLDCINYAESNYDYGILSNVDTTLQLSYSADTTNVFKSFKGLSSSKVQTVDYGCPIAGDHFIYVKYRKDSSGNSNNDSLQFKVRMEQTT
jgi:hypothetical protein